MKYLLIFSLLIVSLSSWAQSESVYSYRIQTELGGELEVSVPDGRADLVTDTHAYEIERAKNWKGAIGQALWYGLQTHRKAGIIIIKEKPEEFKYVQQLYSALSHGGLDDKISVMVYPDDFPLASLSQDYSEDPVVLNSEEEASKKRRQKERAKQTATYKISSTKTDWWITKNSKKRHNKSCKVYENSRGGYCGKEDGVPAGCCGG